MSESRLKRVFARAASGRSAAGLAVASALLVLASTSPVLAAAPRLQVFFAADFKGAGYQKKAFDKVARSWSMPKETPTPGGKAVVVVTIKRDGTTGGTRLHHRSGSDPWDAAALKALSKAPPFDPLPKNYKRDTVEAHFHFEYAR